MMYTIIGEAEAPQRLQRQDVIFMQAIVILHSFKQVVVVRVKDLANAIHQRERRIALVLQKMRIVVGTVLIRIISIRGL